MSDRMRERLSPAALRRVAAALGVPGCWKMPVYQLRRCIAWLRPTTLDGRAKRG